MDYDRAKLVWLSMSSIKRSEVVEAALSRVAELRWVEETGRRTRIRISN